MFDKDFAKLIAPTLFSCFPTTNPDIWEAPGVEITFNDSAAEFNCKNLGIVKYWDYEDVFPPKQLLSLLRKAGKDDAPYLDITDVLVKYEAPAVDQLLYG